MLLMVYHYVARKTFFFLLLFFKVFWFRKKKNITAIRCDFLKIVKKKELFFFMSQFCLQTIKCLATMEIEIKQRLCYKVQTLYFVHPHRNRIICFFFFCYHWAWSKAPTICNIKRMLFFEKKWHIVGQYIFFWSIFAHDVIIHVTETIKGDFCFVINY